MDHDQNVNQFTFQTFYMVVFNKHSKKFKESARVIAAERGERLVEDLDDIDETEPVIYVDHPAHIDPDALLKLQKRHLENGPTRGTFGVITGFTPALAEELYFREQHTCGNHVVLNPQSSDELSIGDDDTIALGEKELNADTFEQITAEPLSSFAANMGGNTIHLMFRDGFVCGVTETDYISEHEGRQPFCIEDGEKNCPYDADIVSVERIVASNVFVNACSPIIANQSTGVSAHVGLNILSRASSLIGPYRHDYLLDHETLLYHSLLRSGYTTDEITYILNKNSHTNEIMSYPYVLFGRPQSKLPDPTPSAYRCRVDEDGTIEITDIDSFVVDITIPRSSIDSLEDRPYVYPVDAVGEKLNYAAFEEHEYVRIIIYSGERMQLDELRLQVSGSPHRSIERAIAHSSIENAAHNEEIGLADEQAVEGAADLKSQVQSFARASVAERFRIDVPERLDDRIDSIIGRIDSISDGIVQDLSDGAMLTDSYARSAVEIAHSATSDTRCPSCGKVLFLKRVSDLLGSTERVIGTCPSQTECGTRKKFDVPVRDGIPLSFPEISGDLMASDGEERSIEFTFENPLDDWMRATFFPVLWRVGDRVDGERIFEPGTISETFEPRETKHVRFTVNDDLLEPNEHYVLARVVGNLGVYSSIKPLYVGEKGSTQFR